MACEGPQSFSVRVLDKQSKRPIDSVLVQIRAFSGKEARKPYNMKGYTDATGKYQAEEMIGYGLFPRKWHFYMDYSKDGYQFKSELDVLEGEVFLERIDSSRM